MYASDSADILQYLLASGKLSPSEVAMTEDQMKKD